MIYRHVEWLYIHGRQLLEPTEWEQVKDIGLTTGWFAKKYEKDFGVSDNNIDSSSDYAKNFLHDDEINNSKRYKNFATQIIHKQSQKIIKLKDKGCIDSFEHLQLEELLKSFYTLQGQNERIKKFRFQEIILL